jgi:hypothetical protein
VKCHKKNNGQSYLLVVANLELLSDAPIERESPEIAKREGLCKALLSNARRVMMFEYNNRTTEHARTWRPSSSERQPVAGSVVQFRGTPESSKDCWI